MANAKNFGGFEHFCEINYFIKQAIHKNVFANEYAFRYKIISVDLRNEMVMITTDNCNTECGTIPELLHQVFMGYGYITNPSKLSGYHFNIEMPSNFRMHASHIVASCFNKLYDAGGVITDIPMNVGNFFNRPSHEPELSDFY